MREIRVAIDAYNLDAFIRETLNFLELIFQHEVDPSFAVAWVDEHEPEYGPEDVRRDHVAELEDERKVLFFPFSASNEGGPILCADGEEYVPDDWYAGEYGLDELDDEAAGFLFGASECLGYLIMVEDGQYVFNSAVHSGGSQFRGPHVELVPDCGVFDVPMQEFITHFMEG